ncbi:MAG: deoxynucleoside kinase [Gammaproteobacteria bacterium]|nr:deoxynucleoside kinase [Gammaproteobacteria bacterium]
MPSAAALQPHPRPPHRFIVVEGPIGVGKTTLASRLAETFNTEILLEHAAENPFLEKFYEDPRATALPTQLYFLFQRARQLEKLRQTDLFRPAQVADFLMQKDELFARITLNEHELDLYYQVYNRLALDAPLPDLVIYLQAPVDVLLRRIYARGVEFEKRIDEDYLRRVADAYIEFFYHYNASPLLIVNTTEFDIAGNVGDYDLLLHRIGDLSHGRHYFNPREL